MELKDKENTQQYFNELNKLKEKTENNNIELYTKLAKALILKSSTRSKNKRTGLNMPSNTPKERAKKAAKKKGFVPFKKKPKGKRGKKSKK